MNEWKMMKKRMQDDLDQKKMDFEKIYAIYPKKRGKQRAFSLYCQWIKGKKISGEKIKLSNREIYLAVKHYVEQQEREQREQAYWKNFDTLMGQSLLDYVEIGEAMSNMIEKSVIGALLIEPDSISGIYEQIKPEMFGDLFCRSVYTEIVRAYDVGKSISLEELAQKLQSEGQTQEYIVQELRGIIPTVECYRIKSYADALESDYKTRRLNELLSHVVPVAGCIDEQINGLLQDLEALKESDTVKIHGLGEVVDTVSGNYFTDPEQSILYTGLPKLDDTLGGLEGGDVIVIGAASCGRKVCLCNANSYESGEEQKTGCAVQFGDVRQTGV